MIKLISIFAFVLILLSCSVSKNSIDLMKKVADAENVSNALYILSHTNGDLSINNLKPYDDKLNILFKSLSSAGSGYVKNVSPMDFVVNDSNKNEIIKICNELSITLDNIRTNISKSKISNNQLWVSNILLSENPGSYYDCINYPTWKKLPGVFKSSVKLKNHPLRDKLEVFNLQEVDFNETAIYDTSLWDMWKYCPKLKILYLASSSINNNSLNLLQIQKMKNLKVLILSGNSFTNLPYGIETLTKLEYLDLSGNQIKEFPKKIDKLANLRYLNIESTMLDHIERERIKKLLPNTMIIY